MKKAHVSNSLKVSCNCDDGGRSDDALNDFNGHAGDKEALGLLDTSLLVSGIIA